MTLGGAAHRSCVGFIAPSTLSRLGTVLGTRGVVVRDVFFEFVSQSVGFGYPFKGFSARDTKLFRISFGGTTGRRRSFADAVRHGVSCKPAPGALDSLQALRSVAEVVVQLFFDYFVPGFAASGALVFFHAVFGTGSFGGSLTLPFVFLCGDSFLLGGFAPCAFL